MRLTGNEIGATLYIQCDNNKTKEMSMIKKLTTHGNSMALVIEKAVLDLLRITPKTSLEISTDGKNIVISPVRGAGREKTFKSALEKVNKKHGQTLKSLA